MIIVNPPLQHIPKRFVIQSLEKESIIRLRKMIVARTGFQLVSFDYSQLELRVLAHLSNDNKLKTRLINNTDFFISLAADLLKKSEYEITSEQRQNAKQVEKFDFLFFFNLFTKSLDLLWNSLWYVKRNICT